MLNKCLNFAIITLYNVCAVPWGVLSTVGVFSTVGGYHEYLGGCSVPVPWGKSLLLFEYPMVLNTPTVLMISPHMHHDIPPRYSNFKGWYPPTILNTPHGTRDIPHVHHDIPHVHHDIPPRYWTSPTVLKVTPHGTHDIPPWSWTPP